MRCACVRRSSASTDPRNGADGPPLRMPSYGTATTTVSRATRSRPRCSIELQPLSRLGHASWASPPMPGDGEHPTTPVCAASWPSGRSTTRRGCSAARRRQCDAAHASSDRMFQRARARTRRRPLDCARGRLPRAPRRRQPCAARRHVGPLGPGDRVSASTPRTPGRPPALTPSPGLAERRVHARRKRTYRPRASRPRASRSVPARGSARTTRRRCCRARPSSASLAAANACTPSDSSG